MDGCIVVLILELCVQGLVAQRKEDQAEIQALKVCHRDIML